MLLLLLAAQLSVQNSQPVQPAQPQQQRSLKHLGETHDQGIEAMAFIVMMESAKSAQEDLKSIMQDILRMNSDKAEVRDLLQAMKKEQARLRGNPELAPEQREWAVSLINLCPPDVSRDDCLIRQLRSRTAELQRQASGRRSYR